jgi:hypothetical protein
VADQTIPAPSDLETQLQQALRYWCDADSEKGVLSAFVLCRHAQRTGAATPRQATNQLLRTALDHLRHSAPLAADLLELRFLDGWPVDRVANRLNYAESTVLRRQREAISQLALICWRMEDEARRARAATIDARIDAPAYTELVGVAEQITTLAEVVSQPAPPWILSLEGIGGIGKTVLAAALLRQLGDALTFDDFAWVSAQPAILDLRGAIRAKDRPALSSAALVTELLHQLMPDEAAGLLSVPERALALLKHRLKQAPHLVVIDNLETVIDLEALLPTLQTLCNPSKFILTTRKRLVGERDIYLFPVPELALHHACTLVRRAAVANNAHDLAGAADADLEPLYATVGGNPLALLLTVGQIQLHGMDAVLADLRQARGAPVENLYTYIYRRAWDNLDNLGRHLLLTMALVNARGDTLDFITATSGLGEGAVHDALEHLLRLNLVQSSGDLHKHRYLIHSLTRSFLLEQVARWQ